MFGVQTALIYTATVGASRLVERHGQRRVGAVSSAILVVGLIWTAVAGSYAELLVAFGVVVPVGMAGFYIIGYETLLAWFERRRGTATGLASDGLGIGLVVVQPGAEVIIDAFGWRPAMLSIAGAVAILCLVVVTLFADRPSDIRADRSIYFDDPLALDVDKVDASRPDVVAILTSRSFLFIFLD